ncbi:hypothetical protein SPWS13_0316 [Shewanella putrefaciens]|nr:hypothetical protein SPWS13_0316 [Shewanella putrefaciens]
MCLIYKIQLFTFSVDLVPILMGYSAVLIANILPLPCC